MILPDANLLLHAINSDSGDHLPARTWWKSLLSSDEEVGLCSVVIFAFVRISTNRIAFPHPLGAEKAFAHVENWFQFPGVQWVDSTQEDLSVAQHLLRQAGTAGNLVTDAQIAAIALRLDATIHTADADFGRFPGVRWKNPLKKR